MFHVHKKCLKAASGEVQIGYKEDVVKHLSEVLRKVVMAPSLCMFKCLDSAL